MCYPIPSVRQAHNQVAATGFIDDEKFAAFAKNNVPIQLQGTHSYKFVMKMCCSSDSALKGWWSVTPERIGSDSTRGGEPVIGDALPKR